MSGRGSRLVFALGRDRYLPRVLGTVSAKHRVPLAALAVNTVLEWALALGGTFDALALISGGAICLVYVSSSGTLASLISASSTTRGMP